MEPGIQLAAFLTYLCVSTLILRPRTGQLNWLLAFVWLSGLLVAVAAPQTVLADHALPRGLVAIADIFTPATRFSVRAAFPQVAALYYALVWLAAPLMFLKTVDAMRKSNRRGSLHLKRSELSLTNVLVHMITVAFFSALFLVFWFAYQGQETRFFDPATSRVQLGLLGMFLPFMGCAFLALIFLILRQLLLGVAFINLNR
jgi:hypothetical protein